MVKSSTARSRNKRGEGELLREEIVTAALEAVRAGGTPETITLRAISRRIGIAPTSIYAHFATMDDIFKAAAQVGFEELTAVLRQSAVKHKDPKRRLKALVTAYVLFGQAQPFLYRLLFLTPLKRTGEPIAGTAGGDAFGELLAAMATLSALGLSGHKDPLLGAALVWTALHGYVTLSTTHQDFPWPEQSKLLDELVHRVAAIASTG